MRNQFLKNDHNWGKKKQNRKYFFDIRDTKVAFLFFEGKDRIR